MKLGDRVKILAPVNGDSHAFQHCKGTPGTPVLGHYTYTEARAA